MADDELWSGIPGGDALTAEEVRGLRAVLSALHHYSDSRFVTAAGEAWIQMFVDAGASMLVSDGPTRCQERTKGSTGFYAINSRQCERPLWHAGKCRHAPHPI